MPQCVLIAAHVKFSVECAHSHPVDGDLNGHQLALTINAHLSALAINAHLSALAINAHRSTLAIISALEEANAVLTAHSTRAQRGPRSFGDRGQPVGRRGDPG